MNLHPRPRKPEIIIRPIHDNDSIWIKKTLKENWGSHVVVSRGRIHDTSKLPGYVAIYNGSRSGLITYHIEEKQCEIVSLNSIVSGISVGSQLIEVVISFARAEDCLRVWLITTNDNTNALRFYQKRGFSIAAIYPNSIQESRKLKPTIPLLGVDEIPIKDEIELEIVFPKDV